MKDYYLIPLTVLIFIVLIYGNRSLIVRFGFVKIKTRSFIIIDFDLKVFWITVQGFVFGNKHEQYGSIQLIR